MKNILLYMTLLVSNYCISSQCSFKHVKGTIAVMPTINEDSRSECNAPYEPLKLHVKTREEIIKTIDGKQETFPVEDFVRLTNDQVKRKFIANVLPCYTKELLGKKRVFKKKSLWQLLKSEIKRIHILNKSNPKK